MAEPEVELNSERQPTGAVLNRVEWAADDQMARRLEIEHDRELTNLEAQALGLLIEEVLFQVTDPDTNLVEIIKGREDIDDDWEDFEVFFSPG